MCYALPVSPDAIFIRPCLTHNSLFLGQVPAVSVAATETGVIATGIGLTGSIAAKDGKGVTTGAARTKSLREASAENHRAETAVHQPSPCVAWPA